MKSQSQKYEDAIARNLPSFKGYVATFKPTDGDADRMPKTLEAAKMHVGIKASDSRFDSVLRELVDSAEGKINARRKQKS